MSRLSSEEEEEGEEEEYGGYVVGGKGGRFEGREREEAGEVTCKRCGGRSFKVRVGSGGVALGRRRVLECEGCGEGI